MIYDSIPRKYAKIERNFCGFAGRCMIRFEFEKLLLQTIVYGGTGLGKTYFVRHHLKLYRDQTSTEGLSFYLFRENENMTRTMTEANTATIVKTTTIPKDQHCDVFLERIGDIIWDDIIMSLTLFLFLSLILTLSWSL